MTVIVNRTIVLVEMRCGECDITFAVPDYFQLECRKTGRSWYCPNGHGRVYRETENDQLRKQVETEQRRVIRERAARELAERERAAAERSASAYKGQTTRLRKRIGNGVCPVESCRRHFQNVERHIANQHPDFTQLEVTADA